MAIRQYTSSADTTITNAYKEGLASRGTGSNMGAADILETFQIYGQYTSSSVELARMMVQFPIATVIADRDSSCLLFKIIQC